MVKFRRGYVGKTNNVGQQLATIVFIRATLDYNYAHGWQFARLGILPW
jgi:hypothetical protein